MSGEFKSDGNGGYTWKVSMSEFRGYTRSKLEELHSDVKEMKADIKDNQNEISDIKVKAAGIGATVSIAVTLLVVWLRGLL